MKTYFSNPQTGNEAVLSYIPDLLEQAEIDKNVRGESLSQEEFLCLGKTYLDFVQHF